MRAKRSASVVALHHWVIAETKIFRSSFRFGRGCCFPLKCPSPIEHFEASFAAFAAVTPALVPSIAKMFGAKRADPQAARKELRNHLVILSIWIAAIRLAPQVLDKYQQYNN